MDVPTGIALGIKAPCWLCGAELHQAADENLNEFVWVDGSGSKIGEAEDLTAIGGIEGACDRLNWLGAESVRLGKLHRTRKGEKVWPDAATHAEWDARSKEYSALLERLRWATFHIHQVDHSAVLPNRDPVPYCCGWPGWLRPSGWQCRRCGEQIALAGDCVA